MAAPAIDFEPDNVSGEATTIDFEPDQTPPQASTATIDFEPDPDWTTGIGHVGGPMELPEPSGDFRGPMTSGALQAGVKKAVETGLSYGPPILAARKLLPKESKVRQAAEGVIEGGGEFASSLAEPENLALLAATGLTDLPPIAARAVSATFAAQMASQLPDIWKAFQNAPDFKAKVAIATQGAATLGFTSGAAKHAIGGEPYASTITSPTRVPEREVRPFMGESPPLRQPGETPGALASEQEPSPGGETQLQPPEPAIDFEPEEVTPGPLTTPAKIQTPGELEIEQIQDSIREREQMIEATPDEDRPAIAGELAKLRQDLKNAQLREDERGRLENAWAVISMGEKLRIQDALRARGVTDEQMAGMTPREARDLIAQPVEQPAVEEPSPAEEEPVAAAKPTESPEELAARREHEAEMENQLHGAGAEAGPEIIEAVKAAGSLPAIGSNARAPWRGELRRIQEIARTMLKPSQYRKLFSSKAPELDRLVTSLRDYGFNIETPQQFFAVIEKRLMSGKEHYGNPASTGYEAEGFAASSNEPPPGTGELISSSEIPFNLRGEQLEEGISAEGIARAKAQSAAEAKKAQATFDFNYPKYEGPYPEPAPPGFSVDPHFQRTYAFNDAARANFKSLKGEKLTPALQAAKQYFIDKGYPAILERVRYEPRATGGADRLGSAAGRTIAKVEALIRANGGEPVWYRRTDGQNSSANGLHVRGTNEVLLDANMLGQEPVLDVAAHEFGHYLRSSAPDLYQKLANHVKQNLALEKSAHYEARLGELGYHPNRYLHEITADVVKDALRDPGRFRQAVNDNLFNRVTAKLKEWWNRILDRIGRGEPDRNKFEDITNDLRATRDKVMETLSEWQKRRRETGPGPHNHVFPSKGPLNFSGNEEPERIQASGTTAPKARRWPAAPPSPQPPSSPAIAKAPGPLSSWWKQKTLGIRKLFAPQTIDAAAGMTANAIRHYNARSAQLEARADHALADARSNFDRSPVQRSWTYDPARPLPRNYQFIDFSERGGSNLSPADQKLKGQFDQILKDAVNEVHRVDPNALRKLITDYFPHLWEDPEAANRVFADVLSHRPLLGSRGFMKQRTLEYFVDGLKAGLRPVSDNPVDLLLTKLHEVNRFIAGKDIMAEMKRIGARKFVYAYEKPPEGWRQVDDPTSTVHGPPFVTVPEAYDEQMRVKTVEILDKLGVKHERLAKLPGMRWGEYHAGTTGGQGPIKTRFAGPLSVYWHELGHALQERYGWIDRIAHDAKSPKLGGRSEIENQLRNLADLRAGGPPGSPTATGTPNFRKYIRTKDEKAAVMLEAYLHAPGEMQRVAPDIYSRVKKFIGDHPEIHGLEEIRPNLVLGAGAKEIPVNGMVILGHWYSPEGAAQVVDNYLSPGLQRFGIVRALRTSSNILNGLQLGFSAFHAGFTTIEQAVSTFALGLNYLGEGRILKALGRMAAAPLAPVAKYYTGKAVQTAMVDPLWAGKVKVLGRDYQLSPKGEALVNQIAELAVKGGLRATTDPFWKTQITRNMIRAWHEGGVKRWAGTPLQLPFALSEQMMRPILEFLVPRQKLGAFAELAEFYMRRLGPNADIHQVRAAMARAADAVEDRMGQMTYDNLFYNRAMRDIALLGFRAYGWQYGKYRSLGGGIRETLQTPGRIARGGEIVTPRMAYLAALPLVAGGIGSVMNYLNTGQAPQDWRDMLTPRTGRLDRNGNPERLSLPTYLKDLMSDWHDVPNLKKMARSFTHKLNPMFSWGYDLFNNSDFWGTKIYNDDDPLVQKAADIAKYTLRTATPFSVTGHMRLLEAHPSVMQQVLPYFGFVPAKRELTMTAAQLRASELMQDTMPRGARTAEQAEHSKFISTLMRDMKEQDPEWQANLQAGLASGKIRPDELNRLFNSLPLTPFQYQVKKLSAEDGMKVWDLAKPDERDQIRTILIQKIWQSKTLQVPEKIRLQDLLNGRRTGAVNRAPNVDELRQQIAAAAA